VSHAVAFRGWLKRYRFLYHQPAELREFTEIKLGALMTLKTGRFHEIGKFRLREATHATETEFDRRKPFRC
jgi:hypothetical protein